MELGEQASQDNTLKSKRRKNTTPMWLREHSRIADCQAARPLSPENADGLTSEQVAAIINPQLAEIEQELPEDPEYPYPFVVPFIFTPILDNVIFQTLDPLDPSYRYALLFYLETPQKVWKAKTQWHRLIQIVRDQPGVVPYTGPQREVLTTFALGVLSAAGKEDLTRAGLDKIREAGEQIHAYDYRYFGHQGLDSMRTVAEFAPECFHRNIEFAWDGIGNWRA